MKAPLYFEAHVTVEPVFDERLEQMKAIARAHGFKVADLLMKRRAQDDLERSANDTFCTGRSKHYDDLANRTRNLVNELKALGFSVWRYKLEDTLCDSKVADVWSLL